MSTRSTLNYKRCKTCKESFVVGHAAELLEDYCSDCEVKGWFADMKEKGCSTCDPDNLGKMPYVRPKKLAECPEIEERGVRYRDITSLMFEDDKNIKTYPTKEEWKKINKYRTRQSEADTKRCVIRKAGYTDDEERKIMAMDKAGATTSEIAKATGRTETAIRVRISVIRNRRED